MFSSVTEISEVTQEINDTGIIPLEALHTYLQKASHFGGESSLGSSSVGEEIILSLATLCTPAKSRGGKKKFLHKILTRRITDKQKVTVKT